MIIKTLYLAAGYRRWPWFVVFGLALAVSFVEALGAVLIFGLVSLITDPRQPVDLPILGDVATVIGGDSNRVILTAAVFVGVFFIVRASIVACMAYSLARVTQSAGARLANRLHRGYVTMPYVRYLQSNSSENVRNIHVSVPGVVANVFVQGTAALSELIIILVLGTILVLAAPVAVGLLVAVIGPVVYVTNLFVRPRLVVLGREGQDIAGHSLKVLQETLQGLREIRVYRREGHFISLFEGISYDLARSKARRSFLAALPTMTLETALVLMMSIFLVFSVLTGLNSDRVLPLLGMFAYAGFRLKPSLTKVLDGVNSLRYSTAAIEDLHEDLKRAEEWMGSSKVTKTDIGFDRSIDLAGVSFQYPGTVTPAVTEIDLSIAKGASVGFVGPTGSGKSTLIDLIIGLLEPDKGNVSVDGVDIRCARDSWFGRLGVVPQSPFLLDTTIRENIALGADDKGVDEAWLHDVLALAQLNDFVERLQDGVDTVLGERGIRLSGGQRQRLAIARALYTKPDVLVLDEGTAALDNRTEAELMAALQRLSADTTLLMVAHRLSTIEHCDVIHVLDEGKLVASGPYEDLLTNSTEFRDLARGGL